MDNVAIVRSGYDAFGRGDIPALLEIFDPEIQWSVPDTVGVAAPYRGPEAVLGFFGELRQQFEELHVEPNELIALDADRVLALGTRRGRVVDGDDLQVPFAHLWTLRDGRAVRFFEYADAALVLRARNGVAATTA
jgi:ketosteroid isomerase-like protein